MVFSWKKIGKQKLKAKDLSETLCSWLKVPKKLEKVIFSDFTAKKSYWSFIHIQLTLFWYKEQLAEITYYKKKCLQVHR